MSTEHNIRVNSASEAKQSLDESADLDVDFPPSPEPHVPVRSTATVKTTSASRDVIVHETFRSLLRPAAAELVGSALFIFVSCGSAMTTVKYQTVGNTTIGIALTFGFTIFTLAYAIGHISGQCAQHTHTLTILRIECDNNLCAGVAQNAELHCTLQSLRSQFDLSSSEITSRELQWRYCICCYCANFSLC